MKALIISDVHSNIYALEAIARAEKHFDAVYCAGDVVDYGFFPREAIAWLQAHEARVVMGNHDRHLLSQSPETCAAKKGEKSWGWVHENYGQLQPEDFDYLRGLPPVLCFEMDGIAYQMQHRYGDGYGTIESVGQFDAFWQSESTLPERRMLFGHTHRRCVHVLDAHRLWMNPGSISYRRGDDYDKRAHYLVVEDGDIRFGAVDYDRQKSFAKVEAYHRAGYMWEKDLQDGYFYFGNAKEKDSPLPPVDTL